MATPPLPSDFKEFLRLLISHRVEFLLIGGHAVGYYGYVRATADMDIWVSSNVQNAPRIVSAIREFGFNPVELNEDLFLRPAKIVRMGVPPLRIELLTSISGVTFEECWQAREEIIVDGVNIPIISLRHLKANKRASARSKDLVDLEHLP
jgi:hypothetical protein